MAVLFSYYPIAVLLCIACWSAVFFAIDSKPPSPQTHCTQVENNSSLSSKREKKLQSGVRQQNVTESERRIKTILLWNDFYEFANYTFGFGQQPFLDHNCPINACYTTANKSHLPFDTFDAVVFHVRNFHEAPPPNLRSRQQRFIFFTLESPQYISYEVRLPNQYFNWTMTYNSNADIHVPYGVIKPIIQDFPKPYTNMSSFKSKTKLAAWMVSHCETHGHREEYVYMLKRYIPIDIYGDCGNNTCPKSASEDCWNHIASEYKFYLSFENSLCSDYVTEKFFEPMLRDIVPIVYGIANYSSLAPPNSYINALDFSPSELARYLLWLNENETEYNKFFWWKSHFKVEIPNDMGFCKLCAKLHKDWPSKSYDIGEWWNEANNCKTTRRPAPPFNILHDPEKLQFTNNHTTTE